MATITQPFGIGQGEMQDLEFFNQAMAANVQKIMGQNNISNSQLNLVVQNALQQQQQQQQTHFEPSIVRGNAFGSSHNLYNRPANILFQGADIKPKLYQGMGSFQNGTTKQLLNTKSSGKSNGKASDGEYQVNFSKFFVFGFRKSQCFYLLHK